MKKPVSCFEVGTGFCLCLYEISNLHKLTNRKRCYHRNLQGILIYCKSTNLINNRKHIDNSMQSKGDAHGTSIYFGPFRFREDDNDA